MNPSQPPSHNPRQPGNAQKENRAWPRFSSHAKTFCQSMRGQDELPWLVHVQDLSCQGLKLVSRRRFEPGTFLRIGMAYEKAGVLLARAIYVTPRPDGTWQIGCTFAQMLQDDELQAWLEKNQ